ncbi:MAG: hypothetical protein E6H00_06025 [Bacillati bacterium ANGP1]|uniref:Uncharacterized protein n=1 Tax=Candidatus Segetimicrobium genomatis TaxID=2569760 RepID=A0A537K4T1_9BACT|nr:MAG: hypothetical protein E6H00_06025 [Terrabacteria group bacterium ANGP1]
MNGGAGPSGIVEHIRHAEAWLRRARGDCARGDARQAVLRLLLAEAEIRRARESGAWMDVPVSCGVRRGRPARVVWAVVAAGLLVVAASALLRPPGPVPSAGIRSDGRAAAAADEGRGILRFESGNVLPFVGFPVGARPDRPAFDGFWGPDAPPAGEASGGASIDVPLRFGGDGSVPAISKSQ